MMHDIHVSPCAATKRQRPIVKTQFETGADVFGQKISSMWSLVTDRIVLGWLVKLDSFIY